MFELSRRTILKGAAALTMAATMPCIAHAREPSVLISGGRDKFDYTIGRGFGRWIQRWHAVDVEIISGSEAMLDRIERKSFSLLLVDPGDVNCSLVRWNRCLRQRDPDLPVLFNSPYDVDVFPRAVVGGIGTEFLQRPFGPRQLKPVAGRYLSAWPVLEMPAATIGLPQST